MEKGHIKQLLEIAKACRKAGITHFKNDMFEITLSDEAPAPMKPRGKSAAKASNEPSGALETIEETGTLTEEQLLMWSVGAGPNQ